MLRRITLLGSLLFLFACGYKAPVKPLQAKQPGPATATNLRQQGEALLLRWQLPQTNQDGSLLEEAPIVDIYRMTFDPQDDCPECFDRSTLLVSIEPDLPEPARKTGKSYLLLDRQVQTGIGYQYKLIARTAANQIGQPVILRLAFVAPVAAPQQLTATALDRSVTLAWQAVAPGDGETLLGYQIYRSTATATRTPVLLNAQPHQKTRFDDYNLENGRAYRYWVRALMKREQQTLEGVASTEQIVVPQTRL